MYLHSRAFKPRPYQQKALRQVLSLYGDGTREMLLHLPTGSGKTVIATLIIEQLLPAIGAGKVLFIAHRKELLDQTADKLQRQLPELPLSIEQGERRADLEAQVIIASIQSLIHRKDTYPAEAFSAIICDECHHALAPSWKEVLQYFHDARGRDTLLLGMTATPRRSDGRSVQSVFSTVAYEISKPELQDLGYLVPIHYWAVKAKLSLDQVKMSGGDFQVGSLSQVMNTSRVRALTVGAWEARGKGKKTIVFCASVPHAHQLAADFEGRGHRAEVIEGRTKNRSELLRRYHYRDFDVLLNYGVLTEGFDDPSIDCVLLARPTTSPLVYNQCLGRGLRPAAGKSSCTVIDIIDRSTHQLQYGANQFAGLPRAWNSRGRDPFREARSLAGVRVTDPAVFLELQRAGSLEEVQDMLMALPPEVVLAGLDGEAVPRYAPEPEPCSELEARSRALHLLEEAGARIAGMKTPSAEQCGGEGDGLEIALLEPEVSNEQFGHLAWHIQRATGWPVRFAEAPRRSRRPNPRAVLQSMLPAELRVTRFSYDRKRQVIEAEVAGLQQELADQVRRSFEASTGLTLNLQGQLSFGFF